MPSFQTKALLVTPIGGGNFRLIPPNCMVSQECVLRQSLIFFLAKENRFLMLFQTCTKLTFGLSEVFIVTFIARNRINGVGSLFFRDRILRFGKNIPQSLKRFLSNFNFVIIQILLMGSVTPVPLHSLNLKTSVASNCLIIHLVAM